MAQCPMTPALVEQSVEIGEVSKHSKPFNSATRLVMLKARADCSLAFGVEPKADPRFHFMDAGETRFYGVKPGHRVAVVRSL